MAKTHSNSDTRHWTFAAQNSTNGSDGEIALFELGEGVTCAVPAKLTTSQGRAGQGPVSRPYIVSYIDTSLGWSFHLKHRQRTMVKPSKDAEQEVRSWGFDHVFTWTDSP